MLKNAFISILVSLFFVACSTSQKTASRPVSNVQQNSSGDRDGSSFEKAVIIDAKNETTGVDAEYVWLKENYPGYKTLSQSLNHSNSKPFDIINIQTSTGEKKKVYFDISKFFGKL